MKTRRSLFLIALLAVSPVGCAHHDSALQGDAVYSKAGFAAVKSAKMTPGAESSAIQKMQENYARLHPSASNAPVAGPAAH